jgi:2-polyprenyl-6-methoxyphenol hydroxylase-like FAD-dependent oxidoreductase
MTLPESTTCVIAGGGPAGMVLGLLLARAGVAVTVLEKHADFMRDFRGDTVHASTRQLLTDLGLAEKFARLPHQEIDRVSGLARDNSTGQQMIRAPRRPVAIVPQWDFLELLATAAQAEPTFQLVRRAEVLGPLRSGARVVGVAYRGPDGEVRELHADLTVACDGRGSTLRGAMGLRRRDFSAPMDVWWFRLPRRAQDPPELAGVAHIGHRATMINRGDYYQIGFRIPKGADADLRARGVAALRADMALLVPALADRVGSLELDDVKVLDVQLNRLHKWYADGILFIGDAAHAMSPAGGIGINLAVADAVSAARILAGPLRCGALSTAHLARVQFRRALPAITIQAVQRLMHARTVALLGDGSKPPLPVRLLSRSGLLRNAFRYVIAYGVLPEPAPAFARR